MISHLFYYQLALLAIIWLFVMLHLTGSKPGLPAPPVPAQPKRKRSTEPKAFEGLTHKPPCVLCDQATGETNPPPPVRPAPMPLTNRRLRTGDTSMPLCPHSHCAYRGWLGLNTLRANGHPSGGPWRQFHCTSCDGYFPEHHGTIVHGKQAAVEWIVRVLACLAAGLGIRATARVFEVDANTVLHWLVEAAEQLTAFSETVVKTPGLSSPCTMECGEGLLTAFGVGFTPHIQGQAGTALRVRPHPVDTLLHLAIAPIAAFHRIGR